MFKIPGRDIYCDTIICWAQEMIWVYVIMKCFKRDIEAISCRANCPGNKQPVRS